METLSDMSPTPPPEIHCSGVYPTLAVVDVTQTCDWYAEKLGFTVDFLWGEPPTHGAVSLGAARVHFWQGVPQLGENWMYFDINNLDAMHARATGNSVTISKAPENYPWGMREFNAVDLNGYNIRFGQNI